MIAVVYHHVMIFTLKLNFPIFSGDFVTVFMVPLFFFISGFVAYKPVEKWTLKASMKKLLNKMQLLMIPTIVFFCLFVYLTGNTWRFAGGYWFTYSLFEMFLIYYVTSYICNIFFPRHYIATIIAVSMLVMAFTFVTFGTKTFDYLQLYEMRIFLPYFIFGILAARFRNQFFRLLDNDATITGLILFIIVASILIFKINLLEPSSNIYTIVYGLLRITLVSLLFNCFRKSENYWSGNSTTANVFKIVGRRTLDIYMIHYFFLWPTIIPLQEYLTGNPNEMLLIPICLTFTAISITLSLIVSKLLRSSKFISTWLFAG